ncbi:type I polyketide synthase [Nocardia transvalensis]|uniref:type I polyketide synthase n=1 Tax=Nocardia transvalensis TaxID=37333 RepID=UPI001893E764|nr:type I polyketide synthase [Nocardia transvalensis]MBF6327047.1 acyltransferase domain-containing protein [Nocardia transvalensis]
MTDVDNDFRIAVVGMACRFPDADTVADYWRNLCTGHESIRPLHSADMPVDPPAGYVHAGSTLADYDRFDAEFFEMSPREVQFLDPQHRLFLLCAYEAFEDAGIVPSDNPNPVGVFAGAGISTYLLRNLVGHASLFDSPSAQLHALHGNASDYLASKVSYKLNLTGPAVAVQTACSTSLVAVHQAVQALVDFQCDVALAGGASVQVPHESGYIYEEGSILSPDGHCRAFDADAAGTVFGSGVGTVVLKRLSDALADGDHIHAVIVGSAVNNDGARKVGYTAPGIAGQRAVIREALSVAGIDARSIGYVEAHGTGTKLGDPIEVAALTAAYREHTEESQYCALGSVKTNVGHLNSAAGVAGFIKAVLAVREGAIPPSLHFSRPNPEIDFAASPFYVNTELREWDGQLRRAAVSAFGIGGTNAHVIVEQPPVAAATASKGIRALPVSARTPEDADRLAQRLSTHLSGTTQDLGAVARTLDRGRRRFAHRRLVIAETAAEAAEALRRPSAGQALVDPAPVWLFAGQGIAVGSMFAELASSVPAFGDRLRECARLLREHSGFDLDAALLGGEGTEQTQVALFAIEYALAGMWREFGIAPRDMLGHSLGELVCATVAGVFELPDALKLVVARGKIMAAAPAGSMLAVSVGADKLAERLPDDVWLAADNSATRCVVAGSPAAVGRFAEVLSTDGIASSALPVAHAFHTPLMDEAATRFAEVVGSVERQAPREPFWSNLTGAPITAEQATDPEYWARQMTSTVRFREASEGLVGRHQNVVGLEVGPGKSLVSFLRTADRGVPTVASAGTAPGGRPAAASIVEAAGRLWLTGVEVDFAAVHGDTEHSLVSLPTYPFALQRYWIDPPEDRDPRRSATRNGGSAATRNGGSAAGEGLRNASAEGVRTAAVPEGSTTGAQDELAADEVDEFTESIRGRVAEVWHEALGADGIAADANFFEVGGDSLMAVHVATRLRAVFPVQLVLGDLFARPTIAGMADVIAQDLISRLDDMSDSEVELLLAERGTTEERS